MVECQLPKLDVAGSNPVSRSIFSITYEHFPHPPNPPFICKYFVFSYLWMDSAYLPRIRLRLDPPMH